jgi:ABC-2 type transport system permease protein
MTTRLVAPPAAGERPAPLDPTSARRAALLLPWRLVRRGALLLCAAGAAFAVVEVVSYRATYPDVASRERLAAMPDVGAVRALQGVPRAVDTVGGFVVWDAGWFLALAVAIWSVLVTTRLLRAEEDTGRADVVLATPLTARRALLSALAVVAAVTVAFGLAVCLALVALGVPLAGSALLGLSLTGVGLTFTALAALAAQLMPVRRRAVSLASGALGLGFVLRMLGNSADEREGLLWTTPFGWVDAARPFSEDRWAVLLLPVAASLALTAAAVAERGARDTGDARFAGADRRRPVTALLTGATAFGARLGAGSLAAWAVGVAVFGVVMGALVDTFTELLDDPSYRRVFDELGFDVSDPAAGFLALMAVFFALVYAAFAAWRIGALRAEEGSGRLEHVLVRGVVRWRWLTAMTALAAISAVVVVLATGAGIWAGAALTGSDDVRVSTALLPLLATLPLVALFLGLSVLAMGVAPRLTVGLPVGLAVLGYVLDLVGPALTLPQTVLDLSPFAWLPRPGEDYPVVAAVVMLVLGVLAAAGGIARFARRDVVGD